jgi:hypothetical protein
MICYDFLGWQNQLHEGSAQESLDQQQAIKLLCFSMGRLASGNGVRLDR